MNFEPRYSSYARPRPEQSPQNAHRLAPDCAGMDFFAMDAGLRQLLPLYLPESDLGQMLPHFRRLGVLAGGRLNELAIVADRPGPELHPRTRWGEDEDWVEYHPAYQEMEHIAFGDFQFHAMGHRGGAFGRDTPVPPAVKYVFQYLFVQAEFGQMCPISVSDTSVHLIRRFGSPELQRRLLPRMLSADMATLWKGTQFMTEKTGGSDVGAIETEARFENGEWRLFGEKWFSSHVDADVALLLARPQGAAAGTGGLALFAMPRVLDDGTRNAYRIVRLKDKLGTRSMASGEVRLEGALAWLVGDASRGLKQMMEQVNLSRLSHGVRGAAMMRRCLNEAMVATGGRSAFGASLSAHPLMRRQLLKLMVPTESALSMVMLAASVMEKADAGDAEASRGLRLLTPLLKFRICRDNIDVATGAMEARGGNGYIEEFVNARLVRDAHIGLLWEGTSNVNALDAIQRAVRKEGAHLALKSLLARRLDEAQALPRALRERLADALERAIGLAQRVASARALEAEARRCSTILYRTCAAILLAWEAARTPDDARRMLLAWCVLRHALTPVDPFEVGADSAEARLEDLLLTGEAVSHARARQAIDAVMTGDADPVPASTRPVAQTVPAK